MAAVANLFERLNAQAQGKRGQFRAGATDPTSAEAPRLAPALEQADRLRARDLYLRTSPHPKTRESGQSGRNSGQKRLVDSHPNTPIRHESVADCSKTYTLPRL